MLLRNKHRYLLLFLPLSSNYNKSQFTILPSLFISLRILRIASDLSRSNIHAKLTMTFVDTANQVPNKRNRNFIDATIIIAFHTLRWHTFTETSVPFIITMPSWCQISFYSRKTWGRRITARSNVQDCRSFSNFYKYI